MKKKHCLQVIKKKPVTSRKHALAGNTSQSPPTKLHRAERAARGRPTADSRPQRRSKSKVGKRSSDDEQIACTAAQSKDSALAPKRWLYAVGDRVHVHYGSGDLTKVYEAKVIDCIEPSHRTEDNMNLEDSADSGSENCYRIHYSGWSSRHDEVIPEERILGLSEKSNPSTSSSVDSEPPPPSLSLATMPNRSDEDRDLEGAGFKSASLERMEETLETAEPKPEPNAVQERRSPQNP